MTIDITKLIDKDIGKRVVYESSGKDKLEEGRIKSWNKKNIFVVYFGNNKDKEDRYQDYTAAATTPEDLVFGILNPKEVIEIKHVPLSYIECNPKVGDRVEVLSAYGSARKGMRGTIVVIRGTGSFGVNFDEAFRGSHALDGACGHDFGQWLSKGVLKLLERPKEIINVKIKKK